LLENREQVNKKSWKQIEEEKKQRELQQFRENEQAKNQKLQEFKVDTQVEQKKLETN